ncbi:hypothetical protein LTR66_008872 [Elasticomyces elasticus]|nr:hypothetical protein LTR66_008872 [Elasticomyces elasticus]
MSYNEAPSLHLHDIVQAPSLDKARHPLASDPDTAPVAALMVKKRKSSKVKASSTIKRSASTPLMRGAALPDHEPSSPSAADKRRNKLGYQRTSVACDDAQQRCQNCIRLKKDCHFYPVEQQAVAESSTQNPSQSLASSTSSTFSTSPSDLASGRGLERHDDYGQYASTHGFAAPEVPHMMAVGQSQSMHNAILITAQFKSNEDSTGANFGLLVTAHC